MKVDLEKLQRASKNIYIKGVCNTELRQKKIEAAIKAIQVNPTGCLMEEYLGVKNYAAFGDQSSDCEYGLVPKYGDIVFEIGRTYEARQNKTSLGEDEIYYLLVARDNPNGFGSYKGVGKYEYKRSISRFLFDIECNKKERKELEEILNNINVDNYE